MKYNVLVTREQKNKCRLNCFSGSDRLLLYFKNKITVDLERKDWTTFGKRRCHRRACRQASHSGREGWQRPARLCPLSQAWFTLSLVPDEYHGVVFEYMQRGPRGKPRACLLTIMWPVWNFSVLSAACKRWYCQSMMQAHSYCLQYVFMYVQITHWGNNYMRVGTINTNINTVMLCFFSKNVTFEY